MAGYQGGADATVIQAVKSAYAVPEGYHASPWDYKEYVEGIANIASFIVGKVNAASERASGVAGFEEGVNKEFWNKNNTDFFVDLKQKMNEWSKTMSMSLPFTKAFKDAKRNHDNGMASLTKILEDQVTLEEIIKRVKDCSGPNQSGYNDAALKSLMEEINGDTGIFDQSVRFTDDGIVVVGKDGIPTLLEDLQNPASKSDGKVTHDLVNTQITGAVDLKSKGNWNDRNKYLVRQNISGHLDAQTSNIIGSAAFDYEHYTADGYMSFADHLMATSGPYNEAFNEWKNTGGIGASQAEIKETKMMMAQELWDDNQSMKDEYLDFVMDNVLDYQVSEQRTKSTRTKTKKTKKTKEKILAEDDRDGGDGDGDEPISEEVQSKINIIKDVKWLNEDQKQDAIDLLKTRYKNDPHGFNKIIATSASWEKNKDINTVDLSDQILDYRDDDFVANTLEREYGHLGFTFEDTGDDLITAYFDGKPYEFETNFVGGGGAKERASGQGLIKWMKKMMEGSGPIDLDKL